ncbi:hypothetical protein HYV50_01100 [Candidatus Pacearchaeota archaeon]|nr:hypothetical protein [Candidatus Pacearchaeota archaeon]
MNKKAQEDSRTSIFPILLVVFLLAVLIIFLGIKGSDILDRLKNFIPGFRPQNATTESIEIIRYDIENNNMQYYDGLSWLDFQNEISLENKKLNHNSLIADFSDNYYGKTRQKERVSISQETLKEFYKNNYNSLPVLDAYIFNMVQYTSDSPKDFSKRGDVYAILISKIGFGKDDNKIYGELTLNANNELKIRTINNDLSSLMLYFSRIQQTSELYKATVPKMAEWRDSVLKKPIKINYKENEQSTSNYFCAEKKDNKFLVVYLDKPKSQTSTC